MDRHSRRPSLRFALTASGNRGGLCMRRLEGAVCEGLRGCVEQGDEPGSLRPCLSSAKATKSRPRRFFPGLFFLDGANSLAGGCWRLGYSTTTISELICKRCSSAKLPTPYHAGAFRSLARLFQQRLPK